MSKDKYRNRRLRKAGYDLTGMTSGEKQALYDRLRAERGDRQPNQQPARKYHDGK